MKVRRIWRRVRNSEGKGEASRKTTNRQMGVRAEVIAEFKSASTLKGVKQGCDETRKNFARSELNKI